MGQSIPCRTQLVTSVAIDMSYDRLVFLKNLQYGSATTQ
jgi:hypothetical protein